MRCVLQAIQDAHALRSSRNRSCVVLSIDMLTLTPASSSSPSWITPALAGGASRRSARCCSSRRAPQDRRVLGAWCSSGWTSCTSGPSRLASSSSFTGARARGVHRDRQAELARAAPVDASPSRPRCCRAGGWDRPPTLREQMPSVSMPSDRHPLALDAGEAGEIHRLVVRACPAACHRRGGRACRCRASRAARRRRARAADVVRPVVDVVVRPRSAPRPGRAARCDSCPPA